MISNKMKEYLSGDSAIRAMFEEGNRLAKEYGEENVFDFSLGNPYFPAPNEIKEAVLEVMDEPASQIHGYMTNIGYPEVRQKIAEKLNKDYGSRFSSKNIAMSVGAAGGLNVILKVLIDKGDEVVVFAPFFAEYKNYMKNFEAELVVVPPNLETFQPNLQEFENSITEKTKLVIVNTPNNPSGVVYTEEAIKGIGKILEKKEKEFNKDIYLLSDEPYRELVYDDAEHVFIPDHYHNTIIGYSWSKSLSIPGQRVGYLAVPDSVSYFDDIMNGITIATRVLGFVNAPSLGQRMVAKCLDASVDIGAYDKNRKAFYDGLTNIGYQCVKPNGAFYIFLKSPIEDDKEFCQLAKNFNILIVPGSAFACPGYVRIAYCVSYDKIMKSMTKFEELYNHIAKDK